MGGGQRLVLVLVEVLSTTSSCPARLAVNEECLVDTEAKAEELELVFPASGVARLASEARAGQHSTERSRAVQHLSCGKGTGDAGGCAF